MTYTIVSTGITGGLIGWLLARAGWFAGEHWQFWAVMLGWVAITSMLRLGEIATR